MNADKIEHRGVEAFQSVYNNAVLLVKDGKCVHVEHTTKRQTVEGVRRIIDGYLKTRRVDGER